MPPLAFVINYAPKFRKWYAKTKTLFRMFQKVPIVFSEFAIRYEKCCIFSSLENRRIGHAAQCVTTKPQCRIAKKPKQIANLMSNQRKKL